MKLQSASKALHKGSVAQLPAIGSLMLFTKRKRNIYSAGIVPGSVVTVLGLADADGAIEVRGPDDYSLAKPGETVEQFVHISELRPLKRAA